MKDLFSVKVGGFDVSSSYSAWLCFEFIFCFDKGRSRRAGMMWIIKWQKIILQTGPLLMSVHFRGKEVQNDVGGNKKQPNNNALYTMIPHLLKGSKKQFWPWWWCWFGLRMIFEFEVCAHNHATLKLWHLPIGTFQTNKL